VTLTWSVMPSRAAGWSGMTIKRNRAMGRLRRL
jgi:hypothetical protein